MMFKRLSLGFVAFLLLAATVASGAMAQTQSFTTFVKNAPSATTPAGCTDYVAVTQDNVTKRVQACDLALLSKTNTFSGTVNFTGSLQRNGLALTALSTAAPGTGLTLSGSTLNLKPAAASEVGGVNSKAVASHNFLTGVATDGSISAAQAAFSDLSGSLACSQMPALTGDVTASAGGCATVLANIPAISGANLTGLNATNIASGTVASARLSGAYSGITGTGTLAGLTVTGSFTATALVTNADLANPATTVNGQTCTLGSSCTAAAAAGTLTGATLASGVTASSLTSVGTLTGGATGAGFTVALGTSTITGQLAAANGGTGLSSLASGIATWLGTPSSANLAAALTDETGSASGGVAVFNNAAVLLGNTRFGAVGAQGTVKIYGSTAGGTGAFGTITMDGTAAGQMNIAGGGGSAAAVNVVQIGSSVQPQVDNVSDFGSSSLRWATVNATLFESGANIGLTINCTIIPTAMVFTGGILTGRTGGTCT